MVGNELGVSSRSLHPAFVGQNNLTTHDSNLRAVAAHLVTIRVDHAALMCMRAAGGSHACIITAGSHYHMTAGSLHHAVVQDRHMVRHGKSASVHGSCSSMAAVHIRESYM